MYRRVYTHYSQYPNTYILNEIGLNHVVYFAVDRIIFLCYVAYALLNSVFVGPSC